MGKFGEPWKRVEDRRILGCHGGTIMTASGDEVGELDTRELAERAAACVNAMAGMNPEKLEAAITELQRIADALDHSWDRDTESCDTYGKNVAADHIRDAIIALEDNQ